MEVRQVDGRTLSSSDAGLPFLVWRQLLFLILYRRFDDYRQLGLAGSKYLRRYRFIATASLNPPVGSCAKSRIIE
jgi:hypothetical protein